MKFSLPIILVCLNTLSDLSLAVPAPDNNAAPFPARVDCGPGNGGLPNIGAPDLDDLQKGAKRLAQKGGTCSTPKGDGKCVRVACNNMTGIYFCNVDGKEGPFSVSCTTVAGYVDREDGGNKYKVIADMCQKEKGLQVSAVSGMAWDASGDWTAITGYANCNHPSEDASENPSSLD